MTDIHELVQITNEVKQVARSYRLSNGISASYSLPEGIKVPGFRADFVDEQLSLAPVKDNLPEMVQVPYTLHEICIPIGESTVSIFPDGRISIERAIDLPQSKREKILGQLEAIANQHSYAFYVYKDLRS